MEKNVGEQVLLSNNTSHTSLIDFPKIQSVLQCTPQTWQFCYF